MVVRDVRTVYIVLHIAEHVPGYTKMAFNGYFICLSHKLHKTIPGGRIGTISDEQFSMTGMPVFDALCERRRAVIIDQPPFYQVIFAFACLGDVIGHEAVGIRASHFTAKTPRSAEHLSNRSCGAEPAP